MRKFVNILTTVLLVFLVALVVLVFVVRLTGNSPSIFGYHVFRVSSGSMEPELHIGDVILVKNVGVEELAEGDTITYKGDEGEFADKMITHRVIEAPHEENGIWYLRTQGIAEGTYPDPEITYSQVEGKFVSKLTFMNAIYNFFLSPAGLIVFVFIIIVLFGYEMISLIVSYRSAEEIQDEEYYAPKAKKKSKRRKH